MLQYIPILHPRFRLDSASRRDQDNFLAFEIVNRGLVAARTVGRSTRAVPRVSAVERSVCGMLTSLPLYAELLIVAGALGAFIFLCRLFFDLIRDRSLWLPDERAYVNPLTNEEFEFPLVFEEPDVYMTFVVPAYNEESRMHPMMKETLQYVNERSRRDKSFSYEIILVDDGSRDKTTDVALEYVKKLSVDNMRVLTLKRNRGKGGAVRRGMMFARGEYILMVDADGATKFSDLERLELAMKKIEDEGYGVAIGSRAQMQDKVERSFFRAFIAMGFNLLVSTLCVKGIGDTQCGFKLFSRNAAQFLFPNLHIERWAFDVELLYMAQQHSIPIAEVGVEWEEVDGSSLDPISASIQMARDMIRIRGNYLFGVWKANKGVGKEYRDAICNKE